MVKVKGPLLSVGAHGSIADTINYSKKKTGQQARKYHKPSIAPTGAQRGQRRITEFLLAQWQNMTPTQKASWETNATASGLKLPGYHYFLREAHRDLYTHHGLCGYWHCNEIVGGKVLDISGQGNRGSLKPTYPSNAPTLITSKNTRFSNALKYDGINDYVNVPASSLFVLPSITVTVWVKILEVETGTRVLQRSHSGVGTDGYAFRVMQNTNKFEFAAQVAGLNDSTRADTTFILGRWYNIVGVATTGMKKLYINGVLQTGTRSVSIAGTGHDLEFGRRAGVDMGYLNGSIDEICLYKRVLSPEEIKTRYKFATTPI